MKNKRFSQEIAVFHGRFAPEKGLLAGYSALINAYNLKVPLPDRLSLISAKHRRYDSDEWSVFTPRYKPRDDLYDHLTFALKYEGIELGVLKALFEKVKSTEIKEIIIKDPTGKYSRKIWFLYEWLLGKKVAFPDIKNAEYVELIDPYLQYPGPSQNSGRHRIRNNLPGVRNFCPIIRKTDKLENFLSLKLSLKTDSLLEKIPKDILMRAASFLILKDSKASYTIEGETPPQTRIQRWGKAIGEAGKYPISKNELLRLQQIVIENNRFIKMGWRNAGGFVGERDRVTLNPIPDHISAKPDDLDLLMEGLITMNNKLRKSNYDPVLAAALIAFGFVFIHPFEDGNGRIHRYFIHHILAKMGFTQKGMIFPVSSVILEKIDEYREVLEAFSFPRLDLIEWKPTPEKNIEVLNHTIDLYRYFDATKQAEFLYSCIQQTIDVTIPEEINYLRNYDKMKVFLEEQFQMPDNMISLLMSFLYQGEGKLSKRAKTKEFKPLTKKEVKIIEDEYDNIFNP
ncbi:Fic family protein [bacterium]|nr:Fic family protein [bacterium]